MVNQHLCLEISNLEVKDLIYEFLKRIIDDKRDMRSICSEFDSDMNLEKESGLSIFKYLVINKIIDISLKERIDVNKNIAIKAVRENEITKVGYMITINSVFKYTDIENGERIMVFDIIENNIYAVTSVKSSFSIVL